MAVISDIKSGIMNPHPVGGSLIGVAVSIVVVIGIAFVALMFWGKISNANIPVVSQAVAPARVYIS